MPQKKLMVLRHTPLASHFANSGHIFVDPGDAEENRVSYIPRLKRWSSVESIFPHLSGAGC